MKYKLRRLSLIMTIIYLAAFLPSSLPAQLPKLKALIVTGQNNHNWQASTPILEQILEDTGLFQVDIAVSPPTGSDMTDFNPDFKSYNALVLNYNGDEWNTRTKQNFVEYVKNSGGVVFYHSADNSFPQWQEYNEIAGLGGWENRSETSGPYYYWQNGKMVTDTTPGIGGYHGAQHDFEVTNRDLSHPITRGLPERWFHARDELYSLMRGPAKNIHLLATAYSAPEQAGTGRHEPVIFTVSYGKGRIFHIMLGHALEETPPPALECAGFIVMFQRGVEWAAQGKVTQQIPPDFPAVTKDRPDPTDVRRRPGFRPADLDKILTAVAAYRYGQETQHLNALADYVRIGLAQPETLKQCEEKLIKFLESDAPIDAKQFVCRQLQVIGTEQSAPVLSRLVENATTHDMARYAMEKIPGKKVDRAFIDLLASTNGKIKIGVIASIGQRRQAEAALLLAPMLHDPDVSIAQAAAAALGSIADERSAGILLAALADESGDTRRMLLEDASLRCAEKLVSQGKRDAALKIYKKLQANGASPRTRAAASGGLSAQTVKSADASADERTGDVSIVYLLAKRAASTAGDEQKTARRSLYYLEGADVDRNIILHLIAQRDPPMQQELLQAISQRRISPARRVTIGKAKYGQPGVRRQAIETLKTIGIPEDLPELVDILAKTTTPEERKEAENTIAAVAAKIPGQENRPAAVQEALPAEQDINMRCSFTRILGKIGCNASLPYLRAALKDENEEIRDAAVRAMADWPEPAAEDDLLQIAVTAKERVHHVLAMQGYIRLIQANKYRQPEGAVRCLKAALQAARRSEEKRAVLGALPPFASQEAMRLAQDCLKDKELTAEAQKAVDEIKAALEKKEAAHPH